MNAAERIKLAATKMLLLFGDSVLTATAQAARINEIAINSDAKNMSVNPENKRVIVDKKRIV